MTTTYRFKSLDSLEAKEVFVDFMQSCSTRLKHSIKNNNAYSIKDILSISKETWLKTPNFGKACLAELEEFLSNYNLSLKEELLGNYSYSDFSLGQEDNSTQPSRKQLLQENKRMKTLLSVLKKNNDEALKFAAWFDESLKRQDEWAKLRETKVRASKETSSTS